MFTKWRHWTFYYSNWWSEQKRQVKVYGWRSYLPHKHLPKPIPAADGFYCGRCGTRRSIVQIRATRGIL